MYATTTGTYPHGQATELPVHVHHAWGRPRYMTGARYRADVLVAGPTPIRPSLALLHACNRPPSTWPHRRPVPSTTTAPRASGAPHSTPITFATIRQPAYRSPWFSRLNTHDNRFTWQFFSNTVPLISPHRNLNTSTTSIPAPAYPLPCTPYTAPSIIPSRLHHPFNRRTRPRRTPA